MRHFFLFLTVFGFAASFLPGPALAEVVSPGSHLRYSDNQVVLADPQLMGDVAQPVYLHGNGNAELRVTLTPSSAFQYIQVEGFSQVTIQGAQVITSYHLRVLAAPSGTRLTFEYQYPQSTNGLLQDVVLEHGKPSSAPLTLTILGSVEKSFRFQRVFIRRRTPVGGVPAEMRIEVPVPPPPLSGLVEFFTAGFSGCSYSTRSTQNVLLFFPEPRTPGCQAAERIPVVFIPGFGTSLNLPLMQQINPDKSSLEGWSLVPFLTDSYQQLLQELTNQGIATTVAYYDWRLPPDKAAAEYLVPVIAKLKAETGVSKVHLVAHSYGGLVARSYIQSDTYGGDVDTLVQMGTPNHGAVKAFPVWQAASLPDDWVPAEALLRWYTLQQPSLSLSTIVRSAMPSVGVLQPTFPFLAGFSDALQVLIHLQNSFLASLNLPGGIDRLFSRVKVIQYIGKGESTADKVTVGLTPAQDFPNWPDGKPISRGMHYVQSGDGTVLASSVSLEGAIQVVLDSSHAVLPAKVGQDLLNRLYAIKTGVLSVSLPDFFTLFFDCPISLKVFSNDGILLASSNAYTRGSIQLVESDQLHWLTTTLGKESVVVKATALADSEVRWWWDVGAVHTKQLHKGDELIIKGFATELVPTETSASPSPQPSSSPTPLKVTTTPKQVVTPTAPIASAPAHISEPEQSTSYILAAFPPSPKVWIANTRLYSLVRAPPARFIALSPASSLFFNPPSAQSNLVTYYFEVIIWGMLTLSVIVTLRAVPYHEERKYS